MPLAIVVAGVFSFSRLGLSPQDILPGQGVLPGSGDLDSLTGFLTRAFTPALDYESAHVPAGARPLLVKVLDGAHRTVVLALMAMSIALLVSVPLGFVASQSWWRDDPARRSPTWRRAVRRTAYGTARTFIALMRSMHELIWAILLLAALGTSNVAAVVAIAIPYAGTLAKVFSEMLDEGDHGASDALVAAGGSRVQAFVFGLLPRTAPDLAAYAFYRLECAVRSSAVLGFFGPETLGKFIRASWSEVHYGEVWTYLYALLAVVLVLEWWSGRLRRPAVM